MAWAIITKHEFNCKWKCMCNKHFTTVTTVNVLIFYFLFFFVYTFLNISVLHTCIYYNVVNICKMGKRKRIHLHMDSGYGIVCKIPVSEPKGKQPWPAWIETWWMCGECVFEWRFLGQQCVIGWPVQLVGSLLYTYYHLVVVVIVVFFISCCQNRRSHWCAFSARMKCDPETGVGVCGRGRERVRQQRHRLMATYIYYRIDIFV